jgi:hypothetical protein
MRHCWPCCSQLEGKLERGGVAVGDPDGNLQGAGAPGLGGGDLHAEPAPLSQVLAGAAV